MSAAADRVDAAHRLETLLNQLMLPRNRGALCAPVIAVAPPGVDAQTYPVLDTLRRTGPTSAARLATAIGIDRSGASRYAARLEAIGLVRRTADPDDRRAARLELTAQGERTAAELAAVLVAHLAELVAAWPAGRADALADGLDLLLDAATSAPSAATRRAGSSRR